MLRLALEFLIIAIIAAFLGFGGIAIISVELARAIFFVFLVLFLASLLAGLLRNDTNWLHRK